jgi:hypothetical protein
MKDNKIQIKEKKLFLIFTHFPEVLAEIQSKLSNEGSTNQTDHCKAKMDQEQACNGYQEAELQIFLIRLLSFHQKIHEYQMVLDFPTYLGLFCYLQ